jgi:NAD-dependent dihydropyrimidine dehydrogenase PreA subunit
MPYVITEPCVGTKNAACVDTCPVDCIHESSNQYYVDPEVCIDCGACEPVCPVQAIFNQTEVPTQWTSYIQTNRTLAEKR